MEKIMAVVTKESKYAERLCNYVNRKNNLIFTAVPFTSMDECSSFGDKHRIALLLADDELLTLPSYGANQGNMSLDGSLKSTHVIGLYGNYSFAGVSEGSARVRTNGMVSKFQSAESLMREVMNCCNDMEIRRTGEIVGRPIRIIGIYCPSDCTAKTLFALALSKSLSRNHRTLYLNLEEFPGLERLSGEEYELGLSDALYHLKQGKLTPQKICSMTYRLSGIDFIPPMRYADDQSAVTGADYVSLVNEILKNSEYEILVLDMGHFAGQASELLDICTTVYMPGEDDIISRMKTEAFKSFLEHSGRERLAARIEEFIIPDVRGMNNYSTVIDMLMYGPLGDVVRSLTEG